MNADLTAGARVWYAPCAVGYGYDAAIPAIVSRLTPNARYCRIALLVCGGAGDRVDITTKRTRLRPRAEAAPIDTAEAAQ